MSPSLKSLRNVTTGAIAIGVFHSKEGSMPGQDILPARRKATILVVDNEAMVVRIMSRLMERAGRNVKTARNGTEAFEIFKAGGVDAVLSDLHMPGGDGLEMLKMIKKLEPDAKVVMMSGRATGDERRGLLDAGAFAVLQKPFNNSELLDIIRKALAE